MRVVPPAHEILFLPPAGEILGIIETAGRTCYKSEDRISPGSAEEFIKRIVDSGHESVIEHGTCTVKFICDRGVSHELVRHRLAAYSQESTRYANYAREKFGREITVIKPCFWPEDSVCYKQWLQAMEQAERAYMQLLENGAKAQEARSVLPNSLKTEVVMTANLREWRHVLRLRCSKPAHPQIREVMFPLLKEFKERIPVLFDDLYELYFG
ncbi:MAG: FAD-dependent thymidylate synthase [Desulfohalobiaceae bacterium]|nr:FAD-dependent thymidylate synthase [Desulfohalobiaceae bacterium]